MTNAGSTARLTGWPSPALYSVPDPQPSATCIAAPKTNAPTSRLSNNGPSAPSSSGCAASSGTLSTIATEIARNCAHIPVGSRRVIQTRQPVVKPNAAALSSMP